MRKCDFLTILITLDLTLTMVCYVVSAVFTPSSAFYVTIGICVDIGISIGASMGQGTKQDPIVRRWHVLNLNVVSKHYM